MAPIRVAIIGLSASAKTSWAADGHLPYLLSSTGRSKYQIVALLNSTTAAAKNAIATYGLPASTKAYGHPQDLADDPDIELVVNNTRVDVHDTTIRPSIEAGKDVYVEWPLTHSLVASTALHDLAVQKNVRTIVGLQGRLSPVVLKITELLSSGKVGTVLSSNVRASGYLLGRDWLPKGLAYFAEREVGGNPVTIAFAHMIDYIHSVLGEYSSFHSHAQIQRPVLSIKDTRLGSFGNSGSVVGTVESSVPDLVSLHGTLQSSSFVADGATLSITYRSGAAFPGVPAFEWTISGTKGDIYVVSPAGPFLQSDSYGSPENPQDITIKVHDFASNTVDNISWDWTELEKNIEMVRGRLVAEVYDRFAARGENGTWPTFGDAIVRHEEISKIFENFDKQNKNV